ncbi:hypothetical protein VTL71DRAFT_13565 [Oculimacula yallundae]|uniref:Uncharacterized protein n=1 Tax=Oculimacula yallundae TaxID=86028 RepID=A0ABR4CKT9_9HELO
MSVLSVKPRLVPITMESPGSTTDTPGERKLISDHPLPSPLGKQIYTSGSQSQCSPSLTLCSLALALALSLLE